jgi:hypothetical protein
MMRRTLFLLAFAATLAGLGAQAPGPLDQFPRQERPKLPDGRDRNEAILKADHEATREARTEREKNDRHVLSLQALKNLEEIEKISKRVRGRMKRF